MWGQGKMSGHWARAASLILALALIAGRLAPDGFMPDPAGAARGFVICTGAGPLQMPDPVTPGHGPRRSLSPTCTVAGGATMVGGPGLRLASLGAPPSHTPPVDSPRPGVIPPPLFAPPPPATGPPTFDLDPENPTAQTA